MVTIVDVNDNAPLLQPFDGAVRENTDSMLITTIQAVDKDASPQYRQVRALLPLPVFPSLSYLSYPAITSKTLPSSFHTFHISIFL